MLMWGQDRQSKQSDESGQPSDDSGEAVSSRREGAEDISAFVGKGVEFKGTISYSGTVRIDGTLEGEIRTDGTLLVGEDAVLQAKVTAGTIVCKGKITGDVLAKERIKLRAPAVVNGSVKTPILSMEDGVLFNGGLEMSQGTREAGQGVLHAVNADTISNVKRAG
jgi:cytoskeletal protein CcmA (bactofilin family)